MNKKTFSTAIRQAHDVYVWVKITEHDGVYCHITKKEANRLAKEAPENELINAELRLDGESLLELYVD